MKRINVCSLRLKINWLLFTCQGVTGNRIDIILSFGPGLDGWFDSPDEARRCWRCLESLTLVTTGECVSQCWDLWPAVPPLTGLHWLRDHSFLQACSPPPTLIVLTAHAHKQTSSSSGPHSELQRIHLHFTIPQYFRHFLDLEFRSRMQENILIDRLVVLCVIPAWWVARILISGAGLSRAGSPGHTGGSARPGLCHVTLYLI